MQQSGSSVKEGAPSEEIDIMHTQSYAHAEQPTHDPVNNYIQILVACLAAIDFPVGIISQSQTEQIGFRNYEVQVLVVDLSHVLCCARRGYLRGEVFEKWAWYGG